MCWCRPPQPPRGSHHQQHTLRGTTTQPGGWAAGLHLLCTTLSQGLPKQGHTHLHLSLPCRSSCVSVAVRRSPSSPEGSTPEETSHPRPTAHTCDLTTPTTICQDAALTLHDCRFHMIHSSFPRYAPNPAITCTGARLQHKTRQPCRPSSWARQAARSPGQSLAHRTRSKVHRRGTAP